MDPVDTFLAGVGGVGVLPREGGGTRGRTASAGYALGAVPGEGGLGMAEELGLPLTPEDIG